MPNKIKIGISSCLLGNNVRYDGGHKLDLYLRDTLGRMVEWMPVCPEVEAGLSVPREAMRLVAGAESLRLATVPTGVDHTERMKEWIKKKLALLENEGLCGFVFKARSPSCGVYDTQIVTPSGSAAGQGPGLFAATVLGRFPFLPVEDEGKLHDADMRERFIERIFAYQRRLN